MAAPLSKLARRVFSWGSKPWKVSPWRALSSSLFGSRLVWTVYGWFLFAFAVTLAAGVLCFTWLQHRGDPQDVPYWRETQPQHLRIIGELTTLLLEEGLDAAVIELQIAPLLQRGDLAYRFHDAQGQPLLSVVPPQFPPQDLQGLPWLSEAVHERRWQRLPQGYVLTRIPWHLPNGERGNLQAISGPAHLQRHRLWQSMWHRHLLLALALFLGLGLLLSWLLSVRLTRPIRHLAHITDRLGQGDLSARSTLNTSNEIGTLGERINRMAANLDRLLTQHRQLLGDVSHELRTPLARLQMAIELALHDLTPSDSPSSDTTARDRSALTKQRWQRARDQIDHLDRLIEELLLYSRLEAWALPLERVPLDASKLTETVIAEVSEQLHPQAVGVSVRYAPWRRPPAASLAASTLYGDARLLARALSNVLRNALQASPPHTEVEVTLTLTPDAWQWTIADRGPGVPEGMREALLRPFVRRALPQASLGAQEGSARGVGLGLSIAQRGVAAHGGHLTLQNRPQGGLLVTISLSHGDAPPSAEAAER